MISSGEKGEEIEIQLLLRAGIRRRSLLSIDSSFVAFVVVLGISVVVLRSEVPRPPPKKPMTHTKAFLFYVLAVVAFGSRATTVSDCGSSFAGISSLPVQWTYKNPTYVRELCVTQDSENVPRDEFLCLSALRTARE